MQKFSFKRLLKLIAPALGWITILFLAAGRLDWVRGWIAVALQMIMMTVAGTVIRRVNPALMEARSKWIHADTKPFDRLFLKIYLPFTIVQPALAGLDARFGWSSVPVWLSWAGGVLFVLANAFITWVMIVNPFAETSVRIQTDRGHTVVASGPYRFVRHPMYVGMVAMSPAIGLVLGSVWTVALGVAMAALTVWRTAMEDRTLRQELPGYAGFAESTRYRLLPGVW